LYDSALTKVRVAVAAAAAGVPRGAKQEAPPPRRAQRVRRA